MKLETSRRDRVNTDVAAPKGCRTARAANVVRSDDPRERADEIRCCGTVIDPVGGCNRSLKRLRRYGEHRRRGEIQSVIGTGRKRAGCYFVQARNLAGNP